MRVPMPWRTPIVCHSGGVRVSSGLSYKLVGLHVPNCELFGGKFGYKEFSLVSLT